MASNTYAVKTVNMSPYSTSSIGPSRISSYSPSPRTYIPGQDVSSTYSYKPSLYSYTSPSPSWSRSSSTLNTYVSPSKYIPTSSALPPKWKSTTFSEWTPPRSTYSTSTPDISPRTSTLPSYKRNSSSLDRVEEKRHAGLNNLGNTCFMNAVLQCLCHTQPLVDYCTRNQYQSEVNYRSSTSGDLIKAFADFVKQVTDSKPKQEAISPHQLQREVQRVAPRFAGTSQQDAQEFLRYLLQGLHEDINRSKRTRKGSYKSDAWSTYKETEDSFIVDLFGGQLKSTLKCTICNNESITYDPFWDLSLPISEEYRSITSLRQCLSLFSSPETLDGINRPFCEACRAKKKCTKELQVSKFPKVLVIHLKRFSAASYGQKLNQMIDCPLSLTNVFGGSARTGSYALYGVVDHDGTNRSGHYIAKCRDFHTKQWNVFNDSRVSETNNIVSSNSYILFYIQE